MKDFSTKQTFIGISLGNQSTADTGVAILDKNLKIITLDKLYTVDDINFFFDNLYGKEDALIVVSMTDNATLLAHKWKLYSKKYQLVQTTGNIKNIEGWQERFSSRGADCLIKLKDAGYDVFRYEISDIKMKLGLNGMFKNRSPHDCKFLQNILKSQYEMYELPSNMLPISQLEAILGAIMAQRISKENKAKVLYQYKGLDVLTLA